jgi:hypothetical protein
MTLNTLFDIDQSVTFAIPGRPCKVIKVVEALAEPYRSAAEQLANTTFANGGLSEDQAAAKFLEAGIKIGRTSIGRHRNGWCTCRPNERNTNDRKPA